MQLSLLLPLAATLISLVRAVGQFAPWNDEEPMAVQSGTGSEQAWLQVTGWKFDQAPTIQTTINLAAAHMAYLLDDARQADARNARSTAITVRDSESKHRCFHFN